MYGSMSMTVHFTGPSLSAKLTPLPPNMEEEEEEEEEGCADATKGRCLHLFWILLTKSGPT